MDIEHKLNLIQQIHREQEENEKYIYDSLVYRNYNRGLSSRDDYGYNYANYAKKDFETPEMQKKWFHGFKFRFLVAVLLFLCFFVLDKKEIVYEEIGSAEIVEYISENMDIQELTAMLMSK